MARELIDIKIEGEDKLKIFNRDTRGEIAHLLRDAIQDIADAIQERATIEAPEGDSGELKEHPVDVDTIPGTVTQSFAFVKKGAIPGSSRSVKGPGGRFVSASALAPGTEVEHIVISVAEHPEHAKWVHGGTGEFGIYESPIIPIYAKNLRFERYGKKFSIPSVRGQKPNPYLLRAYEYVDHRFVPERTERLRATIDAFYR